ncbi:hypothetical protein DV515_00015420 [Chloebia gouldiae]|uniref:Uncharacterized protein n=1 Tax=Chloebia gouldiae TaxID=44316 RepID=A0A3L8RWM7_CHLGU|nr:hypothetical protein DV515_00015420 [Chloebia gouldiae]
MTPTPSGRSRQQEEEEEEEEEDRSLSASSRSGYTARRRAQCPTAAGFPLRDDEEDEWMLPGQQAEQTRE